MAVHSLSDLAPAQDNALTIFAQQVQTSAHQPALRYKQQGSWLTYSWLEWDKMSRSVAGGLRSLGLNTGDRVCILASTRWEWVVAEVGSLMAGAVTVPIYQSSTAEQVEYIVSDSGARVIFAEDPHQLEKLLDPAVRSKLSHVAKVVLLCREGELEKPDAKGRTRVTLDEVLPTGHSDRNWVVMFDDLCAAGQHGIDKNALENIAREVTAEDIFTIVYTSGTTGAPKGVVLLHRAIVAETRAVEEALSVGPDDEQLLFLPLAHIFARVLSWVAINRGCLTTFAESIAKLVPNMQETRPTFVGAVPRVYEKAYAKIQSNFAEKRKKPVAKKLIDWALGVGQRASAERQAGREPAGVLAFQAKLANKLVFSKVQATFGGRLRFFISGGAPLSADIARFFHSVGVLILEGYGLTETTAATHVNRLGRFRFGTVGPAVPGVEIKIARDGEVLARGDIMLKEYYNKPEATREVLDADGWFHTGDIGVIEEGFLRITDRKKDIIVTAGGKNVAPQNLEGALKSGCPFVSQAMVHGDKRNFLSALITVSEEALLPWAKEQGVSFAGYAELTQKPEVRALIQSAVDKLNATLPSWETIKKFAILDRDFSLESGELTPTLKVKRKAVTEKLKKTLDAFYA